MIVISTGSHAAVDAEPLVYVGLIVENIKNSWEIPGNPPPADENNVKRFKLQQTAAKLIWWGFVKLWNCITTP